MEAFRIDLAERNYLVDHASRVIDECADQLGGTGPLEDQRDPACYVTAMATLLDDLGWTREGQGQDGWIVQQLPLKQLRHWLGQFAENDRQVLADDHRELIAVADDHERAAEVARQIAEIHASLALNCQCSLRLSDAITDAANPPPCGRSTAQLRALVARPA